MFSAHAEDAGSRVIVCHWQQQPVGLLGNGWKGGVHECARSCVERILERVAAGRAELMVASHNQGSVQAAARRMHALGLTPATSGAPVPPLSSNNTAKK